MKRPTIKIALRPDQYAAINSLAQSVIESMTANIVNFPAPSPSLAALQAASVKLSDAMAAWANKQGSKLDLANLRNAARKMRNLLIREAAYVTNLVNLDELPEAQTEFLVSSGFKVTHAPGPQGRLEAVDGLRLLRSRRSDHEVKLNWKRPLNVTVTTNVKVYLVYRSATVEFKDAVFLACATKTTFTDSNPIKGKQNTYFVIPFNNAGNGAVSDAVSINVMW